MKRQLFPLIALAAASLITLPAMAVDMKPGLWQINNKIKGADPKTDSAVNALLQQLAQMPADQRSKLEELARQNGMSMPKVNADGALGVDACITPEMAARKEIPTGQQGDCKTSNVPVEDGLKMSFSCTNPQSSGEGKLRFESGTAFSMLMNVTTSARGTPEQMTVDTTGKWLAANCPAKPH